MIDAKVTLDAFEGPIELLYHLIEKSEINIYDIPISLITEQYLDYLQSGVYNDMDSISEFVLMAATLLEIKSKMLLPRLKEQADEETDPREELVTRLLEYKRFKDISEILTLSGTIASQKFYKTMDNELIQALRQHKPHGVDEALSGITLNDLYKALTEVMNRRELKTDKIRGNFNAVVRDLFTVEDKIVYIKDLLALNPVIRFSSIFAECMSKTEVVVTFLALLELCKVNEVQLLQNNLFDDIEIQEVVI